MSGSSRDGRNTEFATEGSHRSLMRALVAMLPWRLAKNSLETRDRLDRVERRLDGIEGRIDVLGDSIGLVSGRLDVAESTLRAIQEALESISTDRLATVDRRVDQTESDLGEAAADIARLRDGLIPASEARWNALFERMNFELEETASLVERILASEPLPVMVPDAEERASAEALARVQPLLVEAFRGSESEISHRMEDVLPLVQGHSPVLDLGCGRGELLVLLREAGIKARGIESDAALVQGAVRRGLVVDHADVLSALKKLDDASVGAVTAFHLFEHFDGAMLLEVLEQCRRVLQPGGIVVAECPNPHNLLVGASLFWQDPTHLRPLLPETLSLFLKASGFTIQDILYLHSFPEERQLRPVEGSSAAASNDARIDQLETCLDQLLHGPRDFRVVATREG